MGAGYVAKSGSFMCICVRFSFLQCFGASPKAAKHKKQAVQLMEYMVSDAAQAWYAEVNNEYPVVPEVPIPTILQTFGQAKPDTVALSVLGQLNRQAVMLMDQAGWR